MFCVSSDEVWSVVDAADFGGMSGFVVQEALNCELFVVGEFAPVGTEKLYAVVLRGVVGGTDYGSTCGVEVLYCEADARCGDNSGEVDVGTF